MPEVPAMWMAPDATVLPDEVSDAREIAGYARQLDQRDVDQIAGAFDAGSFEMVTSYVWVKAMAALKRQLGKLGMEFIGEMLGRPEIDAESEPHEHITDYEAIKLAEELGMMTPTDAIRLRHTREIVLHFAHRGEDWPDTEVMSRLEAANCLRNSVQAVLSKPSIEAAVEFASFRRDLERRAFSEDDPRILTLRESPYFFKRTVLSILLSLVKTAEGAQLEHGLANMNVILPLIWEDLRKPERWQAGATYAELHAKGQKTAVAGMKKALVRVHGFDFVPETLRSSTFSRAAERVLQAHEDFNNFYNEPRPMKMLAQLGTAIPMPAFAICMTATVCVRLGNSYGESFAAQSAASEVLRGLPDDRWAYFLRECLPGDRRVLEKLTQEKPASRWMDLVSEFNLDRYDIDARELKQLLTASRSRDLSRLASKARRLIAALGYSVASA